MPKGVYVRKPRKVPTCGVDGCVTLSRSSGAGLCEMHYGRIRRNGHLNLLDVSAKMRFHTGGYILIPSNGHPLAPNDTYVYEHRAAMYADRGAGPFNCHWCGKPVSWSDLHVDHLDEVKDHNDPANLVPSCPTCNQARGLEKMRRTQRAMGIQLTVGTRTMCVAEWAREFDISATSIRYRMALGWSDEEAVMTPKGPTGPKRSVSV